MTHSSYAHGKYVLIDFLVSRINIRPSHLRPCLYLRHCPAPSPSPCCRAPHTTLTTLLPSSSRPRSPCSHSHPHSHFRGRSRSSSCSHACPHYLSSCSCPCRHSPTPPPLPSLIVAPLPPPLFTPSPTLLSIPPLLPSRHPLADLTALCMSSFLSPAESSYPR